MDEQVYTLGVWRVLPGKEEAFVAAWKELGQLFSSLPRPPAGPGTLIQSLEDAQLFYSFGPWGSQEDIQAMRADPRAPAAIGKLTALCTKAQPGAFRLVATAP